MSLELIALFVLFIGFWIADMILTVQNTRELKRVRALTEPESSTVSDPLSITQSTDTKGLL